jgi:hypothetical protein
VDLFILDKDNALVNKSYLVNRSYLVNKTYSVGGHVSLAQAADGISSGRATKSLPLS